MPLTLHTIKPAKDATKKRKRVGRGNASGHGTYSTRGLKGQRSRSGGKKGLRRLGMKTIIQNIPKKRGFKSQQVKNQVININELNQHFSDGQLVSPASLLKAGLIDTIKAPVKILGDGELRIKNLEFSGVKMSQSAREQTEKAADRKQTTASRKQSVKGRFATDGKADEGRQK
jgi:large subunit ribosomal protein L15